MLSPSEPLFVASVLSKSHKSFWGQCVERFRSLVGWRNLTFVVVFLISQICFGIKEDAIRRHSRFSM